MAAKLFSKILIANRGEIACRVIRTCRRLGIQTVAVYSDADASALHVEMADEAVHLGPPPAAQSYLLGEKIVEACLKTGAEAVHPGYGFLSEREWFPRALADRGIAFIGPPPSAIAATGDKIEAKKLAKAAGVNVVPGFVGEIADTDHAVAIATEIGFPVMMKASAGGGGKGMRLAFSQRDVREGFDAVRREAKAGFGDDRVFIEKFVEQPRHIEIQVLGDTHGHVLHLNERDCSIQRRHQKVVEESPSPFVTPDMRAAMGAQAVELAKAVGYHSAGTVEFIAGADRSFYFLEMNTRLQVEHPVTECVTGLDLVEWMIRIAAGEKLPFTQDDIRLDGHAIETRFYAEDPYRGFLPSTGRLARYAEPATAPGLRIDSGVVEGSEISMFYDPMIAKVITHAPTRLEAADAQVAALDRFHVRGISHNADFLSALMQHPRFRAGETVTTAFIAEEYPEGFAGAPGDRRSVTHALALGSLVAEARERAAAAIDHQLGTKAPAPRRHWVAELDGAFTPIGIDQESDTTVLTLGEARLSIRNFRPPLSTSGLAEAEVDGRKVAVQVDREKSHLRLTHAGRQHRFRLLTLRAAELQAHMIPKVPPDLSRYLLCPMPGLVVSIQVNEGDRVEAGQPLAVVEAMKMENILRAEKAGTVGKVHAQAGDSLAVDAIILEFA